MTPENFVYWLNGYLEIENPEFITKDKIQEIRNHVNLVLKKETPKPTQFNPNKPNIPLYTCHNEAGDKLPGLVSYPFGPVASC